MSTLNGWRAGNEQATVKENILFGCEFDEARYRRVLSVCALEPDLEQLPAGDGTQIGERGITLSGGQKQRLSVARACYSDCDVVFLDDPLSAVDAHVGHHIFRHCIDDFLKERTVIMSCHQLQYVAGADQIVLIEDSTVLENWSGKYDELLRADLRLSRLMREHGASADMREEPDPAAAPAPAAEEGAPALAAAAGGDSGAPAAKKKPAGKTMTTEERQTGRVALSIYTSYAKVFGCCAFCLVFVWFSAGQCSQVLTDWWMGRWSSSPLDPSVNETWVLGFTHRCDAAPPANATAAPPVVADPSCWTDRSIMLYYITVWGVLSLMQALFAPIKALTIRWNGLRASRRMHERMLNSLLHAPTRFFDITPVGR